MIAGQRFGRLTALRDAGAPRWMFRCDCGTEKEINSRNVERALTRSCGCLQRQRAVETKTTHGHAARGKLSAEYQAYRSMIARCYRPTNNRYDCYGGRGIRVCQRWRESFAAFLTDVGPRPSPKHSIDRIDNDGDYEPGNVRWAVRREQMQNRTCTLIVTAHGRAMTLPEAAEVSGIPYATLKARIFTHGWDHERAMREPVRRLRYISEKKLIIEGVGVYIGPALAMLLLNCCCCCCATAAFRAAVSVAC